jgi:hypothetical protein
MKMHLVLVAAFAGLSAHAAFASSEGGDTWSDLEATPYGASPTESLTVATTAPLSTLWRESPSVYGAPAQADSADEIMRMGPDTHWINIQNGETVEFIARDKSGAQQSFTWRFDVSPAIGYVDLSKVAPAGFPARNFRVFVAEDPHYTAD